VALFLVSSYTIGSKLVGESHLLSTLTGIGIYIFLMTVLSHFPVNYPAVWASILLAPILLDWRSLPRRVRFPELRSWPDRCAAAFLAFVLLMHWLVVLEPEKSADGLAMHLAIATNIAHRHAFTFEPAVYVWAAMPKGADFAYSIVYQIGGEYGARLLNFAMLLLLVALLYRALRSTSIFLPALFATTPLVQLVTGSLFVENTLAAMILGAISAIWAFGETRRTGFLYAAAILGGTALSVKLGALSFLLFALPFLIWEVARLRPPVAACALACFSSSSPAFPPTPSPGGRPEIRSSRSRTRKSTRPCSIHRRFPGQRIPPAPRLDQPVRPHLPHPPLLRRPERNAGISISAVPPAGISGRSSHQIPPRRLRHRHRDRRGYPDPTLRAERPLSIRRHAAALRPVR
jgi:hypothetical protein